ncbi:MAG: hypothetical protein Q7N95_15615 [Alphaproteobacteria bacterium]|nr:hypothetical protein [Alphaproteobacteria bacterium]MDP3085247.1 hypothetical protein [Rubrivivax sp.]
MNSLSGRVLAAAVATVLTACTPTLDWRELRAADGTLTLLLPCKPASHARKVQLAGQAVTLTLLACRAGEVTWALAHADMVDPARVTPALDELRQAALANLGATTGAALPLAVAGATPNPSSSRVAISGHLPDGSAVQEELAVFARGTRVFQATAVGARLEPQALQTFFTALRAGS